MGIILGYVTLDHSSLAFDCIWFCLVVIRWYLVQTGLAIIRTEHLLMSYISQAPAHISVSAR